MAGRQKKKPAPKRRRRIGLAMGATVAALLALCAGAMHLNARIVHVRYAEAVLSDLPAGFDGTRVLFVTDVDLCGTNTAANVRRVFQKLQALQPDLLLLGGDYASPSLLERLNGRTGDDEIAARRDFFAAIADFQAPLGKLAVSGDNDGDADSLQMAMIGSGVQLIDGSVCTIEKNGESIAVVGVGETGGDVAACAAQLSADQCAIALLHRPSKAVDVRIAEASGGGMWADLVLAGHTHGGQLQVAGRSALSLEAEEKRYPSGWTDGDAPMLISQGLGCEGANFRFGSQAEVWLITLWKK